MEHFGGVENINLRLTPRPPRPYEGIQLVLNFNEEDEPGKYKEGDNWIVPCSIRDTRENYPPWEYEAVISPDKSISLRKPGKKEPSSAKAPEGKSPAADFQDKARVLEDFIDGFSLSSHQVQDGTIYMATPYTAVIATFDELQRHFGDLSGKRLLDLGTGDLRVSLVASNLYGMKATAVEKDSYMSDIAKERYDDALREGFADKDGLQLLTNEDAFELSWDDFDIVFFFYTQPAGEKGEEFRKRLQDKAKELKPGSVLAILFTGGQLAAKEDRLPALKPILSSPQEVYTGRSALYTRFYEPGIPPAEKAASAEEARKGPFPKAPPESKPEKPSQPLRYEPIIPDKVPSGLIFVFDIGGEAVIKSAFSFNRRLLGEVIQLAPDDSAAKSLNAEEFDMSSIDDILDPRLQAVIKNCPSERIACIDHSEIGLGRKKIYYFLKPAEGEKGKEPIAELMACCAKFLQGISEEAIEIVSAHLIGSYAGGFYSPIDDFDICLVTKERIDIDRLRELEVKYWRSSILLEVRNYSENELAQALKLIEKERNKKTGVIADTTFNDEMLRAIRVPPETKFTVREIQLAREKVKVHPELIGSTRDILNRDAPHLDGKLSDGAALPETSSKPDPRSHKPGFALTPLMLAVAAAAAALVAAAILAPHISAHSGWLHTWGELGIAAILPFILPMFGMVESGRDGGKIEPSPLSPNRIVKFGHEMDLYLALHTLEKSQPANDDRIKHFRYRLEGGFQNEESVNVIETDKEEGELSVYTDGVHSVILVENLRPNERIATSGIKTCVGCALYATTPRGTLHGVGHFFADDNIGCLEEFKKEAESFIKILPEDMKGLKVVFYYYDGNSDKHGDLRRKEIKNLIEALQKKFPFAKIIEHVRSKKNRTSMVLSRDMWGIDIGYTEADVHEKIAQFWEKTPAAAEESRKQDKEPGSPANITNRKGGTILSLDSAKLIEKLEKWQGLLKKVCSLVNESDGVTIYLVGGFARGEITQSSDLDINLEPGTRIKSPKEYPQELRKKLEGLKKKIEGLHEDLQVFYEPVYRPHARIDRSQLEKDDNYLLGLYVMIKGETVPYSPTLADPQPAAAERAEPAHPSPMDSFKKDEESIARARNGVIGYLNSILEKETSDSHLFKELSGLGHIEPWERFEHLKDIAPLCEVIYGNAYLEIVKLTRSRDLVVSDARIFVRAMIARLRNQDWQTVCNELPDVKEKLLDFLKATRELLREEAANGKWGGDVLVDLESFRLTPEQQKEAIQLYATAKMEAQQEFETASGFSWQQLWPHRMVDLAISKLERPGDGREMISGAIAETRSHFENLRKESYRAINIIIQNVKDGYLNIKGISTLAMFLPFEDVLTFLIKGKNLVITWDQREGLIDHIEIRDFGDLDSHHIYLAEQSLEAWKRAIREEVEKASRGDSEGRSSPGTDSGNRSPRPAFTLTPLMLVGVAAVTGLTGLVIAASGELPWGALGIFAVLSSASAMFGMVKSGRPLGGEEIEPSSLIKLTTERKTGFELRTEEERREIRAKNQVYLKEKGWWDEIKSIRYRPFYILEEPELPKIMDIIAEEVERFEMFRKHMVVPMIVHPDDIPKVTDDEVVQIIRDHIKSFAYFLQSVFYYAQGDRKKGALAYKKALRQAEIEHPKEIQRTEKALQKMLKSIQAIEDRELSQIAEEAFRDSMSYIRGIVQAPNIRTSLLSLLVRGNISEDLYALANEIYIKSYDFEKTRFLFELGLYFYDDKIEHRYIPKDFALNLAFIELYTNPEARGVRLIQSILGIVHGMFTRWVQLRVSEEDQIAKGLQTHFKRMKDSTMEASSYVQESGTAVVLGAGSFVVLPLVEMLRETLPDGTLKYKKIILVELGVGLSEEALDDLIRKNTITQDEASRIEIVNTDASLILDRLTARIDKIMLNALRDKSRKFPRQEIEKLFKELADPAQVVRFALPADERPFSEKDVIFFGIFAMAIQDFVSSIKDYIGIWSKFFYKDMEDWEVLRQWDEEYSRKVQKNVAGLIIEDLSRMLRPQGMIFLADGVGLQYEKDGKKEHTYFYGPEGLKALVSGNLPLQIINRDSWSRPLNVTGQEVDNKHFLIESLALRKEEQPHTSHTRTPVGETPAMEEGWYEKIKEVLFKRLRKRFSEADPKTLKAFAGLEIWYLIIKCIAYLPLALSVVGAGAIMVAWPASVLGYIAASILFVFGYLIGGVFRGLFTNLYWAKKHPDVDSDVIRKFTWYPVFGGLSSIFLQLGAGKSEILKKHIKPVIALISAVAVAYLGYSRWQAISEFFIRLWHLLMGSKYSAIGIFSAIAGVLLMAPLNFAKSGPLSGKESTAAAKDGKKKHADATPGSPVRSDKGKRHSPRKRKPSFTDGRSYKRPERPLDVDEILLEFLGTREGGFGALRTDERLYKDLESVVGHEELGKKVKFALRILRSNRAKRGARRDAKPGFILSSFMPLLQSWLWITVAVGAVIVFIARFLYRRYLKIGRSGFVLPINAIKYIGIMDYLEFQILYLRALMIIAWTKWSKARIIRKRYDWIDRQADRQALLKLQHKLEELVSIRVSQEDFFGITAISTYFKLRQSRKGQLSMEKFLRDQHKYNRSSLTIFEIHNEIRKKLQKIGPRIPDHWFSHRLADAYAAFSSENLERLKGYMQESQTEEFAHKIFDYLAEQKEDFPGVEIEGDARSGIRLVYKATPPPAQVAQKGFDPNQDEDGAFRPVKHVEGLARLARNVAARIKAAIGRFGRAGASREPPSTPGVATPGAEETPAAEKDESKDSGKVKRPTFTDVQEMLDRFSVLYESDSDIKRSVDAFKEKIGNLQTDEAAFLFTTWPPVIGHINILWVMSELGPYWQGMVSWRLGLLGPQIDKGLGAYRNAPRIPGTEILVVADGFKDKKVRNAIEAIRKALDFIRQVSPDYYNSVLQNTKVFSLVNKDYVKAQVASDEPGLTHLFWPRNRRIEALARTIVHENNHNKFLLEDLSPARLGDRKIRIIDTKDVPPELEWKLPLIIPTSDSFLLEIRAYLKEIEFLRKLYTNPSLGRLKRYILKKKLRRASRFIIPFVGYMLESLESLEKGTLDKGDEELVQALRKDFSEEKERLLALGLYKPDSLLRIQTVAQEARCLRRFFKKVFEALVKHLHIDEVEEMGIPLVIRPFFWLAALIDKTFLRYCSAGYWAEVYAHRGLELIKRFRGEAEDKDIDELESLVEKYDKLIRNNDRRFWLSWMLRFSPVIFLVGFGWDLTEAVIANLSLGMTLTVFLKIAYWVFPLFAIETFACSSSHYRYYRLIAEGKTELADIIGRKASGPHTYKLFKEIASEVKREKQKQAATPGTAKDSDKRKRPQDEISRAVAQIKVDSYIKGHEKIKPHIEKFLRRFIVPESENEERILVEIERLKIYSKARFAQFYKYLFFVAAICPLTFAGFIISLLFIYPFPAETFGEMIAGIFLFSSIIGGSIIAGMGLILEAIRYHGWQKQSLRSYHSKHPLTGRPIILLRETWTERTVIHEFGHFIANALVLEDKPGCFGEVLSQLTYGRGKYDGQALQRQRKEDIAKYKALPIDEVRKRLMQFLNEQTREKLSFSERLLGKSPKDNSYAGAYITVIAKALFPNDDKKAFEFLVSLFREEKPAAAERAEPAPPTAGGPACEPNSTTGKSELDIATRVLNQQQEILSGIPLVREFQRELPGAVLRDDVAYIPPYSQEGREQFPEIDNIKRIADEPWGQKLSLDDPNLPKLLQCYIERPAQSLVMRILKLGGESMLANAYGPGLKGVFWIKDKIVYFTPLQKEDFIIAPPAAEGSIRGEREPKAGEDRLEAELEKIPPAAESAVKCVIFDWGNVIMRYDYALVAKWLQDKFGIDQAAALRFFEDRNANPENLIYQYEHGEITGERLMLELNKWAKEELGKQGKFFPEEFTLQDVEHILRSNYIGDIEETIRLMRVLKDKGYKLRILSTISRECYKNFIEQSEAARILEDPESNFYASDLQGVAKPDPEAFLQVVNELRLAPAECLFVDDILVNVDGARKAGLVGFLFNPDGAEESIKGIIPLLQHKDSARFAKRSPGPAATPPAGMGDGAAEPEGAQARLPISSGSEKITSEGQAPEGPPSKALKNGEFDLDELIRMLRLFATMDTYTPPQLIIAKLGNNITAHGGLALFEAVKRSLPLLRAREIIKELMEVYSVAHPDSKGSTEDYRGIIEKMEAPFEPESILDGTSEQVGVVKSGKTLEFTEGVIYHGRDGLDRVIRDNNIPGDIKLGRNAYYEAVYPFNNTSDSPAIFVFSAEFFNKLVRDKKANLRILPPAGPGFTDPYPTITSPVPLNDVIEIWISEDTYERYQKIISRPSPGIEESLKPKLLELFDSGKLKVVPGLKHAAVDKGVDQYWENNQNAVARYMMKRDLLAQMQMPRFRIAGEVAQAAPQPSAPQPETMSPGNTPANVFDYSDPATVEAYESEVDGEFANAYFSQLNAIMEALGRTRGKGLEIGVGTGRFSAWLKEGVEGIKMVGIDLSEEMLKRAKDRGISRVLGKGEKLPFPEGEFDFVLIINTLEAVEDAQEVISEAKRVLKNNGKIIVSSINKDSTWFNIISGKFEGGKERLFSATEIIDLLNEEGFTVTSTLETVFDFPDKLKFPQLANNGFRDGLYVVVTAEWRNGDHLSEEPSAADGARPESEEAFLRALREIEMREAEGEGKVTKEQEGAITQDEITEDIMNRGEYVPIFDERGRVVRIVPIIEFIKIAPEKRGIMPKRREGGGIRWYEAPESGVRGFIRDLSQPEQLTQNMVEAIFSIILSGKKLVMVFDNRIGEGRNVSPLGVIRKVKELKREPRFKRLLKNLVIIETQAGKIHNKIQGYLNEQNTEVFIFARASERTRLENFESKPRVSSFYIDESKFITDAYYPLVEIATIALAKYLHNLDSVLNSLELLGIDLNKLNIDSIVPAPTGALIFTLLPNAKPYDKQDLMRKYANLKRLLIAA
ncbi:MAG: HAD-IA family hydrolase [Candidatus Omnitrophota bacterium]